MAATISTSQRTSGDIPAAPGAGNDTDNSLGSGGGGPRGSAHAVRWRGAGGTGLSVG